jgi:hypothetical protein
LPLIELMLTLNLLLFMAVFVLWTRAPFAVRMLFERLRQRHPRLDRQTLVSLTCLIMDWL